MTNQLNCDTRTTFHTFESQAFANWICSHLPKVAVSESKISRIQQFVNINTLIRSCVVQPDFKNDLRNCLDMMRMIYSSESSLAKDFFGCPKKKLSEVCFADDLTTGKPSSLPRTSTPSRSPARVGQKTLAASLMESFEELRLESGKTPPRGRSPGRITSKLIDSFHELTLTETNFNAALEYWFSSFLYESMSEQSIQCFEEQFHALRALVAQEQCAVLGKKVKPRPPSIMCETFAMCVLRWLRRLEDTGWDSENFKLKNLRDSIVKSYLEDLWLFVHTNSLLSLINFTTGTHPETIAILSLRMDEGYYKVE
ncbi:hypothetical protein OSTOST_15471 [Ostertagia ostertagi]